MLVTGVTARLYDDDSRRDRVFELAWGIADTILGGSAPADSAVQGLQTAVMGHPSYASSGQGPAGFNGVPGM
jgi:hypothetical protein